MPLKKLKARLARFIRKQVLGALRDYEGERSAAEEEFCGGGNAEYR